MLPSNNSMTSTHNNSMVHMSEYTPTAIQDLSVLVSVVPADQLYLSVSPTGASDSNNNSMTGMLGGNLYNNNGSMNNASMLGNNSIVFNNNSSIAVSRLPFGPSLLGTTPNALPGSSALLGNLNNNSMVNNNSFGNTRSFDDVLLLKKQLMENPLGTSPGDHPSLTVKARADAYRIHLLYGAKTEEDGEETPKKKQVAQTRAKWSQFEELVQFVASVCPDLSPPSPPSALLLRSGEELHGSLAHSPPGMGRSSTSNSSREDDLVVTAEEREMRKDYMAEYLNYILQKKEASCLREVQTFVGYAQFVQGERHQARYRRHEAKEKPGPSPQDRLKSDHSDSSGRRTKKKLSKRSKHTDKTGSDKQDPSEANQTHTKRHKSGRVQENNSFKSNSATDHGHRSRRAPVSSSSSSDDDASSSSSSSVTQSSVSFSSSSHAHSSHSHHRHNSSRGGKHDSGAKSKNNPFNTNEDYARMAEECFRMIDRHNNGYVTVGEMQWFFMCAFPAAFSHLTRLVREWSVDEGTQLGWDPWTECAPPGVTDVLPSWFKEEVGIPSHLQRQYDMQSFQSLFWRLLREGRQRSEEERTVTLEMWLDQYWILEYSWIYLSTAAVVNGQEWASFRARIRAIKEEYHKYIIQKRQAELALPGTNNSLSESPSTPSEAHPMSIRDLPQWVLSAASAAVMELPHRVRGMSPVEVLSFLFVLSESGLRLMGLEELLYWIVSQPYLQLATFTFEEMSSLLDSLSKAMPFSELLRGLTQGGLSPSSRAGGSCVLRLASRSAPTADPVVLAEIDDKIIQHSWRVRGARCVNCERTLELLHQYEKDMPQLREENLALSSQLAKALEANEELRREIQAARLSAEHHTRHGGSQKTLHDEREGLADPNGNSHSNILPDENINLSPSSSTTSNCNQLYFLILTDASSTPSSEPVVRAGPLLYHIPSELPPTPGKFMLDFFPCADDHRAKEQIVLRDTDGGRLVSFIISGGQLSVHGRKSVPKPSPEILSWGNTSVNLLDPVPFLGEHAARATPPAEGSEETTTKAAAPLTLRPKAWHRLECSFQWVTHTCVVRLSLLRQDGKAHGTQHVHKIIMESDSTGMHSVDIFPRADLVLCYCNMCLLYT